MDASTPQDALCFAYLYGYPVYAYAQYVKTIADAKLNVAYPFRLRVYASFLCRGILLFCLIHPFLPPSFSYTVCGLVRLNLSPASALHRVKESYGSLQIISVAVGSQRHYVLSHLNAQVAELP
jgi:hypothetical protein